MPANSDLQLTSKDEEPIVQISDFSKENVLNILKAFAESETHFLNTGERKTINEILKSVPK